MSYRLVAVFQFWEYEVKFIVKDANFGGLLRST